MAEYGAGATSAAAAETATPLGRKKRLEAQFSALKSERSRLDPVYQELGDMFAPMRVRLNLSDEDKAPIYPKKFIDPVGAVAARTGRAGMMSGMASPSRPWMKWTAAEAWLNDRSDVSRWCDAVTQVGLGVLGKSNYYRATALQMGDSLVFGTSPVIMKEDPRRVIRCFCYPVGRYVLAQDNEYRVCTFMCEFRMTVAAAAAEFGLESLSIRSQEEFKLGRGDTTKIEVLHAIYKNPRAARGNPFATSKPWAECFLERGAEAEGFLRESGYDEFAVMAARWELVGWDVYGHSPGMLALGEIKQLQAERKREINAIDKMTAPALIGPASLKGKPVSLLPNGLTLDDLASEKRGLRPIHEVPDYLGDLRELLADSRRIISRVMYEDLWRKLIDDERSQRATAAEIRALQMEKMGELGPVIENHTEDVFDPGMERLYQIMVRRSLPAWAQGKDGLLPQPPAILQGQGLKLEYTSLMSQAQKFIGTAGSRDYAADVLAVAPVVPAILDTVDWDEWSEEMAVARGVSPKIVRSQDDRAALRAQRAQQQAQQAALEQVPAAAKATKDMAGAPMDEDSALTRLLGTG